MDTTEQVKQIIRTAYRNCVTGTNDLVRLVDLHRAIAEIATLDRAEIEQALKAMNRSRECQLNPDPNRRLLTAEDRELAITVGPEPCHLVSIR